MTEHHQDPPAYESAVTTGRSPELLARKHGFESLAQLVDTLPQSARVLDVGAGTSLFGREVATMRPDISWVNFDFSYQNPDILKHVREDAPPNIEYVVGDATKLDQAYEPESFDAVFSYWLLPHLSLDGNVEPAERAAESIFTVTKPGGLMSVGPKIGKNRLLSIGAGKSVRMQRDGQLDAAEYAKKIVAATEPSKTIQKFQTFYNESMMSFFGTTNYHQRDGKVRKIYNPELGEYVPLLTRKGVKTAGRLAISLAKHATHRRDKE